MESYTTDNFQELFKEGIRTLKGRDFDGLFNESLSLKAPSLSSFGDFETDFSVHGVFVRVIAGPALYKDKPLCCELIYVAFKLLSSGEAGRLKWEDISSLLIHEGKAAGRNLMYAADVAVPKGKMTIIFTAAEVEEKEPQLHFDINMGTCFEDMKRMFCPTKVKKGPKLPNPAMIKAAQAATFEEERSFCL